MKDSIRIAAVQMTAELGDVDRNIATARRLADQAFKTGAQWVILPEFFTSAMAFHPLMLRASRPLEGSPFEMLRDCARENGGVIGGSFISEKKGGRFNTFVLVFPDGAFFCHDKDQPTMWENCYYQGGGDNGVLKTPAGNVGVALCWEFIRTRTVKRLLGRVDFVVGGSCWWTLPDKRLPLFPRSLHEENLVLMRETPSRFARMLGVPVIHAAHAGTFAGRMPLLPGFPYRSRYLGETQIVDCTGTLMARMGPEEGQGFIMADVDITRCHDPVERCPEQFWIPELPWQFQFVWRYQNLHGSRYYRRKV